jgi:hypothetical protein
MEIVSVKVGEPMHNLHDVSFDDIPTRSEELAIKTILTRGCAIIVLNRRNENNI